MTIYDNLFDSLRRQDRLLTNSKHLAIFLQQNYARYQQLRGRSVWETPKILSLTTWLYTLWVDSLSSSQASSMQLLHPRQEQVLWETIISQSLYPFVNLQATAQLALQAWHLSQQWQLDQHRDLFTLSEDTRIWQIWADHFLARCQASNWLTSCHITKIVSQLVTQKRLTLPQRIFLLGFDNIPPQYQTLFSCLATQGCQVIPVSPHYSNNNKSRRLGLPNTDTELHIMANWAYQLWQQGEQRIGCVVLSLEKRYQQVLTAFQTIFQSSAALPVVFTVNRSLSCYPLLYTALASLSLSNDNKLSKISQLLRSPYISRFTQEQYQRALLDRTLRNHHEPWISLDQLINISQNQHCPQLAQRLQRYLRLDQLMRYKIQCPSYWVSDFEAKLKAIGWPGEHTLNNRELQLLSCWTKLLSELASLDPILGRINQATALYRVQQLADHFQYQPQGTAEAPIQVLDPQQAIGQTSTHLWVMGLDDSAWPPAVYPNPFLPYTLQRRLAMPYASCKQELQAVQRSTTALAHSAPEVILSYPLYHENIALRPSRFILPIKPTTLDELGLVNEPPLHTTKPTHNPAWEYFQDEQAPALQQQEKLNGTTSLLKQQAACPFQAFAHFRLKTQSCYLPKAGLSASERGLLLHRTLELLWQSIGDYANLQTHSETQLREITKIAIDKAVEEGAHEQISLFKQYLRQLEKKRLQQLLQRWLEIEKARPPFKVLATEKPCTYRLAQLSFQLRVDRIDRLADASYLLVDYKSSPGSLTLWLGERIIEPQLPIYCLSQQPTVQAIAFAQLCPDRPQLKGISAQKTAIHGILPADRFKLSINHSWETLMKHWQQTLEQLAGEFQQGYAAVAPKEGANTCRHCDLQLLCRIQHPN